LQSPFTLAWRQLSRERLRLLVAVSGTGFAVILMLMQLGFRDALFQSSVRFHVRLNGDVVILNPKSQFLVQLKSFTRRRLDQARAVPGVESVCGFYFSLGVWKYPRMKVLKQIIVLGFDPRIDAIKIPEVSAQLAGLKLGEAVLVDRASRPEYGALAKDLAEGTLDVELNDRKTRVAGTFVLGTSFGIDGTVLTSDVNFLRLFPARNPGLVDIGLVRLAPGADPAKVRDRIAATLPKDVLVLTMDEYMAREIAFWNAITPIGYVFNLGVVIGLVVGGIIVSQILFADVSDHMTEYATLKAMGHKSSYLYGIVLCQSIILALLGYLPGLALSAVVYHAAEAATQLPMTLTAPLCLSVFVLTLVMCCLAGMMALHKLRRADPAEIFG